MEHIWLQRRGTI